MCSLANDLSSLAVKTPYGTSDEGLTKTFEYRRFLSAAADGKRLSYWHDVPMKAASGAGVVHAVIEITRKTKAKMEIATDEKGTPIKQDIKKGKLRDYNIPIDWNYGAIPQTWEEPEHEWKGLEGHQGDNDPVDVVDLSTIDVVRWQHRPSRTLLPIPPPCASDDGLISSRLSNVCSRAAP